VRSAILAAALLLASTAGAQEPAYKLHLEVDLPALAIAAMSVTPWFIDLGPAYCAPLCDPKTVNAFDRPFAGRHEPGWTTAGTIVAGIMIAAAPSMLFSLESPRNGANDLVVVGQSVLFSNALGVIFNVGVRRPRPFLYGGQASLEDRLDTNASFSFYSGHTAASFAATIGTWRTLDRLHVDRKWKWLALSVGLAGSSFVAISRVAAGDHFPSDVIVGAGMGTSFGFLMPALHDGGISITPTYTADAWAISAVGYF
jgi:membrane-associated phospholipid phosphatase